MAAKPKLIYVCSACGREEPQWQGRCKQCGAWNSFEEDSPPKKTAGSHPPPGPARSTALHQIEPSAYLYFSTCFAEFDRVLGQGFVPGSVIMLGGEPGIGKSTLLLQIASRIEAGRTGSEPPPEGPKVLYISAEESASQLKIRAERLGCADSSLHLHCSSHLQSIIENIRQHSKSLKLTVIDSLQTITDSEIGLVPGRPNQLRHITQLLQELCRHHGIALLLIAHLTKDGTISGPRTVEHMVDCVLYFEHGENDLRILRCEKNRFGSSQEVGIFEIRSDGLRELPNPQEFLINRRDTLPAGIVVATIHEGSRCLLVEIQALTVPAKGSISRVFTDRIEHARISRIAAVLERHTGIPLSNQDLYINIAGGLKAHDVAVDLPIALALLSAHLGKPIPAGLVSAGELSLAGELRPIKQEKLRIKNASDYGMKRIFLSPSNTLEPADPEVPEGKKNNKNSLQVERFRHIKEIKDSLFDS